MASTGTIDRIQSIDFFRGITMFLLVGEFTGLYSLITDPSMEGSIFYWVGEQFHHHAWNGLRFWDLVQPFFMFLVGVSLPFAINKRSTESETGISSHIIKRSVILLLLGWGLYCIGPGRITFNFQNVLAQIAFTYLIAYLIMDRSLIFQIVFSIGLLGITELLYRLFPVEGFNQAFVAAHNFGEWIEYLIDGETPGGHWVSINALPTAAHTIWGVLVGKLLMSGKPFRDILKQLVIAGILLVLVGYLMDPVTPIIKRIATSSFVIVSGGWSILLMALSYWVIDIKKKDRIVFLFGVVSMNSLFIYVFAHLGGCEFIEKILHPFTYLLFDWGGLSAPIITSVLVWFMMWYLCYWMYKKRLFIKI